MVSSIPKLQCKKLIDKAIIPAKGSLYAAGYDLHAIESGTVPAKGKVLVGTGLSFGIPTGNYGRIAPRSGLAAKNSIDIGAGVIDSDYRGEVKVLLFNFSDTDFEFKEGINIDNIKFNPYVYDISISYIYSIG